LTMASRSEQIFLYFWISSFFVCSELITIIEKYTTFGFVASSLGTWWWFQWAVEFPQVLEILSCNGLFYSTNRFYAGCISAQAFISIPTISSTWSRVRDYKDYFESFSRYINLYNLMKQRGFWIGNINVRCYWFLFISPHEFAVFEQAFLHGSVGASKVPRSIWQQVFHSSFPIISPPPRKPW
jgi:hypothetical protein